MTEAVLFAIILALITGYKKTDVIELFEHWSIYPIIFTGIVQACIVYLMIINQYWFVQYSNYIKTVSILFYLPLICKYKLYDISIFSKLSKENNFILFTVTSPVVVGVVSMCLGSLLNFIVMKFNGGKMPVFADVSLSIGYIKSNTFEKMLQYGDWHVFGNHETKLIFLTDIYDIFISVMSIGDILIRLFVVIIVYYSIRQIYKNNRKHIDIYDNQ